MKAIILAAGKGKRLQEASAGLPKCMIKIGEKTILQRQIDACRLVGIKDFVFVLGFREDFLKNYILSIMQDNENVVFKKNDIYDKTNTLYSLYLTTSEFDDDFIYFNADVVFEPEILTLISEPSEYSQLLLETKKCGEEEVKMIIDKDYRILEIGKKLPLEKCVGEFIGVGKFNKNILPAFIKHLKKALDEEIGYTTFFEYAVNTLAKEVVLKAVPTKDIPCIEIDFPQDLEMAIKMFG